jgi:hypothetical protein
MVQSDTFVVQCPTCGKRVRHTDAGSEWFPFCSRRCKLIDLGKWFDEEHKIESPDRDASGPPR